VITWLTIKTFLKKAWAWIKKYWYVPALAIYTLVMWIFFRKGGAASEVLKIQGESHKAQIRAINDAHKEELEKKDAALKQYNDVISSMEKEYKRDKKTLDNKKKKEVKKIVEEHGDNPAELAKIVAERFGFLYIEKRETE